jgi:N-acetyl-anhydromuramoyl-L-alanine amidase
VGCSVQLLVIHGISLPAGQFGGGWIETLFSGGFLDSGRCDGGAPIINDPWAELRELRVSAHFLIRRDGELLQFVATHMRAWHAGVSSFLGRSNCNDFSIGVELEGTDLTPYTDVQYLGLVRLYRSLAVRYPTLPPDAVVGHQHIAPGRKSDPGEAFDWPRFFQSIGVRPARGHPAIQVRER